MKTGLERLSIVGRWMLAVLLSLDMNDWCFWSGLCCLWWGCSQIYGPLAPIVCGGLLIGVGLYGATRKAVE